MHNFWLEMLKSLRIPITPRRKRSKHATGRVSDVFAYRAVRQQKTRAARAMRKIQRRRDHGSSCRQRSGRRR
jgi:hypothetical protein